MKVWELQRNQNEIDLFAKSGTVLGEGIKGCFEDFLIHEGHGPV